MLEESYGNDSYIVRGYVVETAWGSEGHIEVIYDDALPKGSRNEVLSFKANDRSLLKSFFFMIKA